MPCSVFAAEAGCLFVETACFFHTAEPVERAGAGKTAAGVPRRRTGESAREVSEPPVERLLEDDTMMKNPDYVTARHLLLGAVRPVGTERIALSGSGGRILARDLTAAENIPPFDRSPYDGYAFRAADTAKASREQPAVLRVLEEIPAGCTPSAAVTEGTASRVMTGAPIPPGADAVIKYELAEFSGSTVALFSPAGSGENIVRAGEDVRKGDVLARAGEAIDPGIAGALAAQGIARPEVYRAPKIGILSTGSELAEAGEELEAGKIRNANRYILETAVRALGCGSVYLGIAGDDVEEICGMLRKGLAECDAVISTGGVSAGNYDLTPGAMEMAGVKLLFRGVDMKPGMACAYGVCEGKPVCGLSGNPASALTNFYALAAPALRKLMGRREPFLQEIRVTLSGGFGKRSPKSRFLRGRLELKNGVVCMSLPENQGNTAISSAVGCDVMAVVPAGSGPVCAGTVLEGFLL